MTGKQEPGALRARANSQARFFRSAAAFRKWLAKNHDAVDELFVGFYKKTSGKTGMTYPEAVDQALCFGWIDGVRHARDAESYTNRFTPRRPRSIWSAVNIRRVGELRAEGLMHEAGLAAFEQRDEARAQQYSFEQQNPMLDPALAKKLRANKAAWAFFQAQPPGYRRLTTWWIMSAKRDETRTRRLHTLIEDSARGERIAGLQAPHKKTSSSSSSKGRKS